MGRQRGVERSWETVLTLLTQAHSVTHYSWVCSLISTVISLSGCWRVCITLIFLHVRHHIVKWAAIVHSHTRCYWDHGTNGGGMELRQHTAGRSAYLERLFFSFLFLQPLTSKDRDKTRRCFPCQSIWLIGSEPSQGFFFVFFATPCQHTPLFLTWAYLLRAITR